MVSLLSNSGAKTDKLPIIDLRILSGCGEAPSPERPLARLPGLLGGMSASQPALQGDNLAPRHACVARLGNKLINSPGKTKEVGSFQPKSCGAHDKHGSGIKAMRRAPTKGCDWRAVCVRAGVRARSRREPTAGCFAYHAVRQPIYRRSVVLSDPAIDCSPSAYAASQSHASSSDQTCNWR